MTVQEKNDGTIELSGRCGVEDAEVLQRRLLAAPPGATVQWAHCEHLHTAVAQVLLASRVVVRGKPKGEFLRTYLAGAFGKSEQSG